MRLDFAQSETGPIGIETRFANRHGLVAGATGTGKTVTLQTLAQNFSDAGIPVFVADVKGDLSGVAAPGAANDRFSQRLKLLGMPEPAWRGAPTIFWDVYAKVGHPARTTISELGPMMLSRLLGLNDTQSSVLQVVFKVADDAKLLMLDLKDLKSVLQLVSERLSDLKPTYGHLSPASLGTIQRSLMQLESTGIEDIFGEPSFDIFDLLQTSSDGRGYVHVLAADQLLRSPTIYSTFLLWLLSELLENLPEVGDADKPKLVFFFDEAHLLFKDTPKALVEKIEQVVRLIRSKGVGLYFVTQAPSDLPDSVLGQLAHRVQHALRAFTPSDQKAVRAAASTMRPNPKLDTEKIITALAVGEALISVLDDAGSPTVVDRALVIPPPSRLGPLTESERSQIVSSSPVAGHYEKKIDRESAFEALQGKTGPASPTVTTTPAKAVASPLSDLLFGTVGPRGGKKAGIVEMAAQSAARSIGSAVGREILRGLLGSITGGTRSRRR